MGKPVEINMSRDDLASPVGTARETSSGFCLNLNQTGRLRPEVEKLLCTT